MNVKRIARSTKNFVANHKVAVAVAVTTIVAYNIHRSAVKDWNEFLAERNLTDEFYTSAE